MTNPIHSADFNRSPFLVIWEMTRSCALNCVHCRAEAINESHPDELTTEQAEHLLVQVSQFSEKGKYPFPLVVLTGGDPMRRSDALHLVNYGTRLGLRMTMTPSGTHEMTRERIQSLKDHGLARLAVSLDGSNAMLHDAFRRVSGSYDWTLNIIKWANEIGLPVQINTTITKHNFEDIDAFCKLLESLRIVLWSVFFLVPTGRAQLDQEISAVEYERVFQKMYRLSQSVSFDIKSTEAPQYRRVVVQQKKRSKIQVNTPGFLHEAAGDRSSMGVNSGNGFVFISHIGEIQPSGFLPITAGNIKTDSLVNIYQSSDLFTTLRNYSLLKGKCGVCEYKNICGGSRSRAYAVTGDPMASDPFCVYVPKDYPITEQEKVFW